MAVARLVITADNRLALASIEETATAANAASDKIVAADEKTAVANERTSASFEQMRRGVTLLGTVAFAGLAFGIDKSVKAAMNWQTQQVALQQVLRNTGQYSAAAMRDLNASVERLATHGGFSEALQTPAITQLIGETHSLTAAQTLNVAATNLARGAHIDYASAISKVEAAMIGQTRGLGKLAGIIVPVTKYTYGWTAAMKASDQAGYQQAVRMNKQATAQEILSAVTKTYAGNITAYNRTAAAGLSNLRNSFEILLRQLGTALLPTISAVAHVFSSIGDWMTSHMGLVKELAKQFAAVGLAVLAVVSAWKLWTAAIKIQEALAAGINPWMLGLTAIALVVTELVTHFRVLGSIASAVWGGIKAGADAVWGVIKAIGAAFAWLGREALKVWNDSPIGGLVGAFGNLIHGNLFGAASSFIRGFSYGIVNTTPSGGLSIGAPFSAGPTPQAMPSANSSVPANLHRAGDRDVHIHVTTTLDGRVLSEQLVHHVLKRAALS